MQRIIGLVSGILFGAGLVVGGMLQPARIVGFLDFFGAWDPTLALVMCGALTVAVPGIRWTMRRGKTLEGAPLELPRRRRVSARLVIGSALFGVGWALAGYCPGPALTNLGSFTLSSLVFAGAMALGMALVSLVRGARPRDRSPVEPEPDGALAPAPAAGRLPTDPAASQRPVLLTADRRADGLGP